MAAEPAHSETEQADQADPLLARDAEEADARSRAFAAQFAGECCLCRRRYPAGAAIVLHAFPARYAHVDCEDAGLEEIREPNVDEKLEAARRSLTEIARKSRAGAGDPEDLLPEIHEIAVQTRMEIGQKRAA